MVPRYFPTGLILAMVIGSLMLASNGTRLAAYACNPGRTDDYPANWGAGWGRSPGGTVGGVYGRILNYPPYAPRGYPRYSSAWVMISRPADMKWAQIGWIVFDSDKSPPDRRTFAQYHDYLGRLRTRYKTPAEPLWASTTYTVLYNNTPGSFTFYVNGTQVFAPADAGWIPTTGDNAGEINTKYNQFPGDLNSPVQFDDVHIWYGSAWRPFAGQNYSDDWSQFYAILGGDTSAIVEDARCTYPN